eukprot:15326281-Ditylum_brightwellii.AAC.1
MPAGVCCREYCMQAPTDGNGDVAAPMNTQFPSGSIGALLEGSCASEVSKVVEQESTPQNSIDRHGPLQSSEGPGANSLSRSLARLYISDFAIVIPDCNDQHLDAEKRQFRLVVNNATIMSGYFADALQESDSTVYFMRKASGTGQ